MQTKEACLLAFRSNLSLPAPVTDIICISNLETLASNNLEFKAAHGESPVEAK